MPDSRLTVAASTVATLVRPGVGRATSQEARGLARSLRIGLQMLLQGEAPPRLASELSRPALLNIYRPMGRMWAE